MLQTNCVYDLNVHSFNTWDERQFFFIFKDGLEGRLSLVRMYVNVRQSWTVLQPVTRSNKADPSIVAPKTDEFCKRMQEARIASGMSLRQLAAHVGLSVDVVADYERGTDQPSDDMGRRMLFALKR